MGISSVLACAKASLAFSAILKIAEQMNRETKMAKDPRILFPLKETLNFSEPFRNGEQT